MKRYATELEFISKIYPDGTSVKLLNEVENKECQNSKFDSIYKLRPL